jgi:uroporphyrinogen decarboxylase
MADMTSLERVKTAFAHREPDKVPIFDFIYSRPLYQEVLGRVPVYYNGEDVMNCSRRIGYDLGVIPFGVTGGFNMGEEGRDLYKDEWGTTWERREDTWPMDAPVAYPLKERSDLKNYVWPDPARPERLKEVQDGLKIAKEHGMAVVGSVRGPFSSTWMLIGIDNLMIKFYDDPDFIDEVLDGCTNFFIEGGKRMAEAGVTALLFADDYGSNTAPLISPDHFRKHILPRTSRMAGEFRKFGIPVIMHSDGCINALFEDLVATGISAYHPVERAAGMDIGAIKRKHGKQIALLGNVNNKTTLVTGTPADIEVEVKECISLAAPGGGYLLASDHSLHDDIPNKNVFALYEAGRRYGTYPIHL